MFVGRLFLRCAKERPAIWSICQRVTTVAVACVVVLFGFPGESSGQNAKSKAKSFRDRVADRATLKDGTHLWGLAISEKPAKLVVRTAWLKTSDAKFYTEQLKPLLAERNNGNAARLASELQKKIDELSDDDQDDRRRKTLLTEILTRLTPDETMDPEFVILELVKPRLRNLETQPAARRELCRLAMLNQIPDYEETEWKAVVQQLQAIPESGRIKDKSATPQEPDMDLSRILSAVDLQMNEVTRVIQSGNQVIDESAGADVSMLLSTMLGGDIQSLLGDLLDEGRQPPGQTGVSETVPLQAVRFAEAKQHSSIVVTGFEFHLETGTATVIRRLFRKADDGKWNLLASVQRTSTTNDVKEGQRETLQEDPQVKQIAAVAEGLGLGGDALTTALNMGAVVQNALQGANQDFDVRIQSFITTKGLSNSLENPEIVLR